MALSTPTQTHATLESAGSSSSLVTGALVAQALQAGLQGQQAGKHNVNREADGGWCLSWCKDRYWGEVLAVGCGVSGSIKVCLPLTKLLVSGLTSCADYPTIPVPSAVCHLNSRSQSDYHRNALIGRRKYSPASNGVWPHLIHSRSPKWSCSSCLSNSSIPFIVQLPVGCSFYTDQNRTICFKIECRGWRCLRPRRPTNIFHHIRIMGTHMWSIVPSHCNGWSRWPCPRLESQTRE